MANTECKYCKKDIPKDAKICFRCGNYQKTTKNIFEFAVRFVPLMMILIAIIQVLIANQQVKESKRKRIEATEALEKASQAEESLNKNMLIVNDELYKLKYRNYINTLGDSALGDFNRNAYERLGKIANDTVNSELSLLASSLILRVYSFHGYLVVPEKVNKLL